MDTQNFLDKVKNYTELSYKLGVQMGISTACDIITIAVEHKEINDIEDLLRYIREVNIKALSEVNGLEKELNEMRITV